MAYCLVALVRFSGVPSLSREQTLDQDASLVLGQNWSSYPKRGNAHYFNHWNSLERGRKQKIQMRKWLWGRCFDLRHHQRMWRLLLMFSVIDLPDPTPLFNEILRRVLVPVALFRNSGNNVVITICVTRIYIYIYTYHLETVAQTWETTQSDEELQQRKHAWLYVVASKVSGSQIPSYASKRKLKSTVKELLFPDFFSVKCIQVARIQNNILRDYCQNLTSPTPNGKKNDVITITFYHSPCPVFLLV